MAAMKNCHNDYKMKFSVDEEFPDLSKHNNHMAKVQATGDRCFSCFIFVPLHLFIFINFKYPLNNAYFLQTIMKEMV